MMIAYDCNFQRAWLAFPDQVSGLDQVFAKACCVEGCVGWTANSLSSDGVGITSSSSSVPQVAHDFAQRHSII